MSQVQGRPTAFVMMPFSDEWADHYNLGIKPACEAAGAKCTRVDEQIYLGNMLERIYAETEQADFVVAEMTGRNPNVFYEVGFAHGIGKPVILLTSTADDIPFDLQHFPHVIHRRRISTVIELLEPRVRWVIEHPEAARAASSRRLAASMTPMERMSLHIRNYLQSNGFKSVSFERIREFINPEYSDEMLLRLIDEFPDQFRRVRLRGNRPGLGLLV